ncbi:hypothetical protein GCM10023215_19250 [Pseudonocardia yuanmonensis]|uniref:Uncharacterized protein n=1 Tax=Pseudonocardia yuanmonensis TaxID=1095914 RepID=A0ABP8WA34_9PSEU
MYGLSESNVRPERASTDLPPMKSFNSSRDVVIDLSYRRVGIRYGPVPGCGLRRRTTEDARDRGGPPISADRRCGSVPCEISGTRHGRSPALNG